MNLSIAECLEQRLRYQRQNEKLKQRVNVLEQQNAELVKREEAAQKALTQSKQACNMVTDTLTKTVANLEKKVSYFHIDNYISQLEGLIKTIKTQYKLIDSEASDATLRRLASFNATNIITIIHLVSSMTEMVDELKRVKPTSRALTQFNNAVKSTKKSGVRIVAKDGPESNVNYTFELSILSEDEINSVDRILKIVDGKTGDNRVGNNLVKLLNRTLKKHREFVQLNDKLAATQSQLTSLEKRKAEFDKCGYDLAALRKKDLDVGTLKSQLKTCTEQLAKKIKK